MGENGHVLRMALWLEVEGQRKKGSHGNVMARQIKEESMKVGHCAGKMHFADQSVDDQIGTGLR